MSLATIQLIAVALAPVIAIGIYIYSKDINEKEPLSLVMSSFMFGWASVFPAIVLETLWGALGFGTAGGLLSVAIFAVVGVGFSEELSKFIFLRFYSFRKKAFNEPFDGIVYAVMVSLGFAAAENLTYVLGEESYAAGMQVALARALTAVPAHATFGIIMGYYAGLAKFDKVNKNQLLLKGLLYAALLHGVYDFFLFTNNTLGMGVGALLSLYIGIRFSRKAIKEHQQHRPYIEPDRDLYTLDEEGGIRFEHNEDLEDL